MDSNFFPLTQVEVDNVLIFIRLLTDPFSYQRRFCLRLL